MSDDTKPIAERARCCGRFLGGDVSDDTHLPARRVRYVRGEVVVTWDDIEAAMKPLVETDEGAVAVASAFYDVAWVRKSLQVRTYSEAFDHASETGGEGVFVLTWRNAGDMVATLRERGENYMDWCFEAVSQEISAEVRAAMDALGLRPVL